MYGNAPATVSRSIFLDPRGKSNFDAGILFLTALTHIYPDLTWGDLPTLYRRPDPQFMAGWWTDMKTAVSNSASFIGRMHSDATRLVTNKKVSGALANYIAAYKGGGGLTSLFSKGGGSGGSGSGDSATSGGAGDFFKSLLGSLFTPEQQQQIEQTGKDYKQSVGIDWGSPVVLGVGGVAVLGVLYAVLHRRK